MRSRILSSMVIVSLLSVIGVVGSTPAVAAPSAPGFTISTVGGLDRPTAMTFAPDGRLFVSEQTGALRVIRNGVLLPTPFVSLAVNSAGERGLLGVAVAPSFPEVNRVYVYYTVPAPPGGSPHNRISWFAASGDVAAPGENVIADFPPLGPTNHNGGGLHFGPDGDLYVGIGENANGANAQNLSTPLGKLLRITPDGAAPADNPFVDGPGPNDDRVWALGLRNPFTFAFQPGSPVLFINDVGENTWEEIDVGQPGANYGWPQTEGPTDAAGITGPVFAYSHEEGCAIAGGAFSNPSLNALGATYANDYFYSDLCSGWIRARDNSSGEIRQLASGIANPVDLRIGPDGALYYLAHGDGTVGRIASTSAPATGGGVFIRNAPSSGVADRNFAYGDRGDIPLFCDWNGDGTDTIGVYRNGRFFLRNTNSTGVADISAGFGDPGDVPVCGDWNGDGTDTIGVYRNGRFFLRNTNSTGVPDVSAGYGDPGDRPVVGDWNGDGTDTIGIFRNGIFFLRNANSTGVADITAAYGNPGDHPVAGDWNGDGTDTIGVWRPGVFLLRNANTNGTAQISASFGVASDTPAVGDFDGDKTTGIAVDR